MFGFMSAGHDKKADHPTGSEKIIGNISLKKIENIFSHCADLCLREDCDMMLLAGDLSSTDALPLVTDCFRFIRDFRGDVPGASAKDCGNYLDMNLPMANYWGKRYSSLLETIGEDRLVYPE